MPAISVIMPCYNRSYDLARVLEAYDAQDTQECFEVIAVDDASTDSTHEVLTAYKPAHFSLRVERLPHNQGPAAARNRGIAAASAPIVLFVGDDIRPAPGFVRKHLTAHQRRPETEVAVLGHIRWAPDMPQNTLMTHIDGVGAQQFSYYHLRNHREYDYRHFYTANVSVKRNMLLRCDSWFDTNFKYAAFEDAEFAYRLAKHGMRIVYHANIEAYHYHYHTIWSFSSRQYKSGVMACVLVRKHPGLTPHIVRGQFGRLLAFIRHPRSRIPHQLIRKSETLALHLASYYEWMPNPLVDELYIRLLNYFYYKGLIEGLFGNTRLATPAHGAHAYTSLPPLFQWFFAEAERYDIPIPITGDSYSLDLLAQSRASV